MANLNNEHKKGRQNPMPNNSLSWVSSSLILFSNAGVQSSKDSKCKFSEPNLSAWKFSLGDLLSLYCFYDWGNQLDNISSNSRE